MTFLAHEIPWESFASALKFGKHPVLKFGKHKYSGPPNQDFYFQENRIPIKRLEHFGAALKRTVRSHAIIERRKLRPSKDYIERARSWTESLDPEPQSPPSESDAEAEEEGGEAIDADTLRRNRNADLRRHIALLTSEWSSELERRLVYPENFTKKYVSENDYNSSDFLKKRTGMYIEFWIREATLPRILDHEMTHDEFWRRCHQARDLSDVLTLLIADAASTPDRNLMTHHIETFFLMIHHREVKVGEHVGLCMDCCYIRNGYSNLASLALKIFLYLNMVIWHVDHGDLALLRSRDMADLDDPKKCERYTNRAHVLRLEERPAYMTSLSWLDMLEKVVHPHIHQAETYFFRRILYPESDDGRPVEVDILSDMTAAKEFLKVLWKIIVLSEVVDRERGSSSNWERMALNDIHEMFHKPRSDKLFYHYEDARWGHMSEGWDKTPADYGWPEGVAS